MVGNVFKLWPVLLLAGYVYGQAKDGIVVYKNTHQPATTIELPYEPSVITAAVDNYLSEMGAISEKLNGYRVFRNAQLVQADHQKADLYFKVTHKSRVERGQSIVSLIVGISNEDIATRNQETHFTRDQAKDFLNKLAFLIEADHLESHIKQQDEVVMRAETKFYSLVNNGVILNKKKHVTERKLQENECKQEKQNIAVDKERKAQNLLESQRRY